MKLILTQEVSGVGTPGDVVEVKDGYARNYLLPRGLAVGWTRGGEKQVTSIRAARAARAVKSLDEARAVKATLESKVVRLPMRAGASGRLFGAVTSADVAAAIAGAAGPSVDRRTVEMRQPIKALGSYTVLVRLHSDVQASVKLEVVAAT